MTAVESYRNEVRGKSILASENGTLAVGEWGVSTLFPWPDMSKAHRVRGPLYP